jgi:hypothetical protein
MGGVQRVIKRELFEHCGRDQKSCHENEHDPGERVFDKCAYVIPCDHICFAGDKPQSFRPGQNGKQHKKGEKPEDHCESDQTPEILLDQFKGAYNTPVPDNGSSCDPVHIKLLLILKREVL